MQSRHPCSTLLNEKAMITMDNDKPRVAQLSNHRLHPPYRAACLGLAIMAAGMLPAMAKADSFAKVSYSAQKDQLAVTIAYRGTNPDHAFSLKWGPCKVLDGGGRTIAAEVLDSQWQDAAEMDFEKTTVFSLADIPCRPAKITLKSAPRFFYTLKIPAPTGSKQ